MSEMFLKNMLEIVRIRSSRGVETPPELLVMLTEAAKDGRLEIFNYKKNRPMGYVAWLNASKESVCLFKRTGVLPRLPHEWNEGKIMVLFDVCFLPGWERLARKHLITYLSGKRCIFYRKRGGVKCFSRKDKFPRRLVG